MFAFSYHNLIILTFQITHLGVPGWQSAEHPTLDFSSVTIPGLWDQVPHWASHWPWSLLKILSPSLCPSPLLALSLFLSLKLKKKKITHLTLLAPVSSTRVSRSVRSFHLPPRSPASWDDKETGDTTGPPSYLVLRLSARKNCSAGEWT